MRTVTTAGTVGAVIVLASLAGCNSGSKSSGAGSAAAATAPAAAAPTAAVATTSAAVPSAAAPSAAAAATDSSSAKSGGASDTNACSLLSVAQANTLTGKAFTTATPSTIATGQDACTYALPGDASMVVIVYQSNSGVSFAMMQSVIDGKPVSGVGDKAIIGDIEIDVQVGDRLLAVQGAGGTLSNNSDKAVAVAKAIAAAM